MLVQRSTLISITHEYLSWLQTEGVSRWLEWTYKSTAQPAKEAQTITRYTIHQLTVYSKLREMCVKVCCHIKSRLDKCCVVITLIRHRIELRPAIIHAWHECFRAYLFTWANNTHLPNHMIIIMAFNSCHRLYLHAIYSKKKAISYLLSQTFRGDNQIRGIT